MRALALHRRRADGMEELFACVHKGFARLLGQQILVPSLPDLGVEQILPGTSGLQGYSHQHHHMIGGTFLLPRQ